MEKRRFLIILVILVFFVNAAGAVFDLPESLTVSVKSETYS